MACVNPRLVPRTMTNERPTPRINTMPKNIQVVLRAASTVAWAEADVLAPKSLFHFVITCNWARSAVYTGSASAMYFR